MRAVQHQWNSRAWESRRRRRLRSFGVEHVYVHYDGVAARVQMERRFVALHMRGVAIVLNANPLEIRRNPVIA